MFYNAMVSAITHLNGHYLNLTLQAAYLNDKPKKTNLKKLLFISIYFLTLLILNPNTLMSQNMIYNFDNYSDLKRWVIVNDDVMGGISSSNLIIDSDGHGVFEGRISTAYNGGFASLRFNCNKTYIRQNTHFKIKIKGDGKDYQFRIKSNRDDYYSYIISFKTSG